MNQEVLEYLGKSLTPEQLVYLAKLVDWNTTGDQKDDLYIILITAYNLCEDEE